MRARHRISFDHNGVVHIPQLFKRWSTLSSACSHSQSRALCTLEHLSLKLSSRSTHRHAYTSHGARESAAAAASAAAASAAAASAAAPASPTVCAIFSAIQPVLVGRRVLVGHHARVPNSGPENFLRMGTLHRGIHDDVRASQIHLFVCEQGHTRK